MIKLPSLTRALTSRWLQFLMLPLLVLAWFAWTDPSAGAADTLLRVQLWAQALLITGVAYLVSKSLTGNVSGEGMGRAAMHGSIAAGLAFAGMCLLRGLVLLGLLLFFATTARAQPLPTDALRLLPELRTQIAHAWPEMPQPAYFAALIEHESCITLQHAQCWWPICAAPTPSKAPNASWSGAWTATAPVAASPANGSSVPRTPAGTARPRRSRKPAR